MERLSWIIWVEHNLNVITIVLVREKEKEQSDKKVIVTLDKERKMM